MTLPQKQLYDKSNTAIQPIVERFIGASDGKTYNLNIEYTAEEDGWIYVDSPLSNGQWLKLDVDGFTVFAACKNGSDLNVYRFTAPVKKGQKFKLYTDYGAGSWGFHKTA